MDLVIGLTGPNAAGKGEVASYLEGKGFRAHSLSDIVREEAARGGFPPEREHLIRTGNLLRREGGAGVLAERLAPRIGRRDVVDSIRNPAEVEVLRRIPGFTLLAVIAGEEVRFRRMRARGRSGDPATFEAFLERERQENASDPSAQRIADTVALADHVVVNDGDLEALRAAVDRWIAGLFDASGVAPIE